MYLARRGCGGVAAREKGRENGEEFSERSMKALSIQWCLCQPPTHYVPGVSPCIHCEPATSSFSSIPADTLYVLGT